MKFKPIKFHCNVPNISDISKSLSTDQRYLFDICTAISKGECDSSLSNRYPGNPSHARFTTNANRLCRLYVSTLEPSETLIMFVQFVLWVYASAHFEIKYNSSITYGAIHLANFIKISRFLPPVYLESVPQKCHHTCTTSRCRC